jgi:hypothetical protein
VSGDVQQAAGQRERRRPVARDGGAGAQPEDDVRQLAHRREREAALEVVLSERDEAGDDEGERGDGREDDAGPEVTNEAGAEHVEHDAGDPEHPGLDDRDRVQEPGDGRRGDHRVG